MAASDTEATVLHMHRDKTTIRRQLLPGAQDAADGLLLAQQS
jgi:hypothetical protein